MATKAKKAKRVQKLAPTLTREEVQELERRNRRKLLEAFAVRFPSSASVMADEVYRALRSGIFASVPGEQHEKHVAAALSKACQAASTGARRRARALMIATTRAAANRGRR